MSTNETSPEKAAKAEVTTDTALSVRAIVIIILLVSALIVFLGLFVAPKVMGGLRSPIEAVQRTCESVGGTYSGGIAFGECVNKDGLVISIRDKELITEDK